MVEVELKGKLDYFMDQTFEIMMCTQEDEQI